MVRNYSKAAGRKVEKVMKERKRGTLKSGRSGKTVKSRKQAIAIGLSEARKAGKNGPKEKICQEIVLSPTACPGEIHPTPCEVGFPLPFPLAALQARTMDTPLTDPTRKFPKPPFPEQKQPWPGLASKMQPKPDHGETSYKGSGAWRVAAR